MKKVKEILLIVFLVPGFCSHAQDLHFSQWYNSPLLTNPANTGFIPNGDYRIGANYRNQWSTVMSVPYQTMSIFGDAQVFRDRIENGWFGLGGVILRDVAGSGTLTSTKVYGSIAYHQMLGYGSLLTAGFNVGWANKRINFNTLKFPDQFDGKFFDTGIQSDVMLDRSSINYFDMQVGMNYAYFPTNKIYINAGFSAQHINRARESFFTTDPAGFDSRIAPRYTGFLNASLKTSNQVIINPMAYYSNQAGASELVLGMNAEYDISNGGDSQVMGGLYYRAGDAVIPMIGFVYKNIRLMFTFDVTTSTLNNYNGSRGAWEFSMIQSGEYTQGESHQYMCPSLRQ